MDERQRGIPDFHDLKATLHAAEFCHTIDFKPAVLAALLRIEKSLARLEKSLGANR